MYCIVETGIYAKTGERFYLTEYDPKQRMATYNKNPDQARIWKHRADATIFNVKMPETISGTVISFNEI